MKYLGKIFCIIIVWFCIHFVSFGQITVDTTKTIDHLVKDVLIGKGIKVSNIKYTGSKAAIGKFEGISNIGFDKGIIITSGYATNAIGPNNEEFATNSFGTPGLPELDAIISPFKSLDAAVLEFDFIPTSDTICFRYVFGSEEYPYYPALTGSEGEIGNNYNDAFGFFISGEKPSGGNYNNENIALIPGTDTAITINTINDVTPSYPEYYIDNSGWPISITTIQYNGFTKVMTIVIPVVPCKTYKIKIAIADGGDTHYDSGVFLEAGSFSSNNYDISVRPSIEGIDKENVAIEGCVNSIITIKTKQPVTKNTTINYTIAGTAIMGIDYANIPNFVTIPAGSDSATIIINPLNDAIAEATETVIVKIPISDCGDTVNTTIEIKDYQNLNLTIAPNDSVCPNDTFTLQVIPTSGLPPYTYNWSNGLGTDITAKTATTVNTTYTVTVKDVCGKTASINFPILVKKAPIANAGIDQTIVKGSITELVANGGSTYSWSTGQMDKVIFVNPIINTTYTLTAYQNGCSASDTVVIYVDDKIIIDAGDDITICTGESTTLTAKGAINTNYTNFTFKGTYDGHRFYYYNNKVKWQDANEICANNKGYLATVNSMEKNNFIQSIIDQDAFLGGTDSVTEGIWKWITNEPFTFTNWNAGEPNNAGNEDYLSMYKTNGKWNDVRGSYSLNFVMEIAPYKWSTGETSETIVVSPTSTTKYYLTVYNGGASGIDSVIVTVNPIPTANAGSNQSIYKENSAILTAIGDNSQSYSWSYNNMTTKSITVTPSVNTTYILTVTKGGCSASDDVSVQVKDLVINTGANKTICEGDKITIKASGADTYAWSNGMLLDSIIVQPSTTTKYKVTGYVDKASAIDSVIVTVIPKPLINICNDTTICAGVNISLYATGGGTYFWSYNNLTTASINVNPTNNTTYRVTVTKNGCINTNSVVVKTNPIPTANAGEDKSICNGDKITLIGSGGGTYSWSNTANTKNITVTPTLTTTYRLTVDKLGCTASDATIVIVDYPPKPNLGGDKNLCKGDYIYLIAHNGDKYSWSNKSTNDSIYVKPTKTLNYSVTVTKGLCSASEEITVNVFNKPTAYAGQDQIIFKGDKTTLKATDGTSYKWSNGGTAQIINISPAKTTNYVVTVYKDGCSNSDDVVVTVVEKLIINAGENVSICNGGIATLCVTGALKYEWSNGDTGAIIHTAPAITTTYTVTGYSNEASATDNIVVFVANSIDANAGEDVIICQGGKASLMAKGGCKFLWSNNSTSQSIQVSPSSNTTYTVTVFSGACTASDDVVVQIKDSIIANAGYDITICQNTVAHLTAKGGETYKWSNTETQQNISVAPIITTTYTLTAYSGACSATDNVVVYVNPAPIISMPTNISICYGMETQITASGGDYYTWTSGHTTAEITVAPLINTEYEVTATKNNCSASKLINVSVSPALNVSAGENQTMCNSGFAILTASGADTYSWNNTSTTQTITVYPSLSTSYSVTGYAGDCSASNIVFVTVNNNIKANAGEDQYICYGGKALLKGYGGSAYSWSTGHKTQSVTVQPTKDSLFLLTVSSGATCMSVDTVKVYVRSDVFFSAGEDQIVCQGDSAHLYARGFGDFIWSNGMKKNIIAVTPQYTTTYTVTLTSGSCVKTDNVVVYVVEPTNLSINNLEEAYCANDKDVLIDVSPLGGNLSGKIFNANYFSPANANEGIHLVSYSIDSIADLEINIFADDFSTDKKWEGYDYIWQRASATESVGCEGNQDPCSDMSPSLDNYILGTNIGDCYPNGLTTTHYISSPEIDCRDFRDVTLSFYRDLGYEGGFWDKVSMSVFDGSKWVDIFRNGISNSSDVSWILMKYNVAKYADGNSRFRVRFGIGPTDETGAYKGWNIDDLIVSGKKSIKCVSRTEKYVRVHGLPPVDAGADKTICYGEKVNLSAKGGGDAYMWTPADYLNKINKQTVLAIPLQDITYSVEVSNPYGCKATDSISIKVTPALEVISPKDSFELCAGSSLNISLSGADFYTWLTTNGVSNPYSNIVTLSPTISTTYKVYGRNAQGCTSKVKDIYVKVHPFVKAYTGEDIAVCLGDSVLLSASGGNAYSWTPTAGLGANNLMQVYAKPIVTTTYTVTVTDKNLCVGIDSLVVSVNPLPIISISNDTSICYGDTASIEVSGGLKYLWEFDATMDNTSASKVKAFPKGDKIYTVKIIDAQGCYATASVKVKINSLPKASIAPIDYICKGDSVRLSASGLDSYTWTPTIDINNPYGDTVKIAPQSNTIYTVFGRDTNGCKAQSSVLVEVREVKPIITTISDSICLGGSTVLKATGGDTYTWDNAISLNDSTLAIVTASPTVITTYTVTVNKGNCSAEAKIVIDVLPLPIVDAGKDTSLCLGDTIQLQAVGGVNYQWSSTTSLSNISISKPMASPKASTTYRVTATDQYGCTASDAVFVQVNSLPTISISTDKAICKGQQSVWLYAEGASQNAWTPATGIVQTINDSILVSPTTTTTYTFEAMDNNGCINKANVKVMVLSVPVAEAGADKTICYGKSVKLMGSGANYYEWAPLYGLSAGNIASPMASPSIDSKYYLTVSDNNGCTAMDSVQVFVNPLPIVGITADTMLCLNDSIMLEATGGNVYNWTPIAGLSNNKISNPKASPSLTTEYLVSVTDVNGCVGTASVDVVVNPLPSVKVTGVSEICIYDSTRLFATSEEQVVYKWANNGGIVDVNSFNPLVKPTSTNTYRVTVIDNNACSASGSFVLKVNPLPSVVLNVDTTICVNASVLLKGSGGVAYEWKQGDGKTIAYINTINVKPSITSTYFLKVTSNKGCSNIDTMVISVNPLPIVTVNADTFICRYDSAQLNVSGASTYIWSPATNLSASKISTPKASPSSNVLYTVVGTDANGCKNTATTNVYVRQLPKVTTTGNTAICINDSAYIGANGAATYSWSPANGIKDVTEKIMYVNPTATTNYAVTGTDEYGCKAKKTLKVTVYPLPIVSITKDTNICFGKTINMLATGGDKYYWLPAEGLNKSNISNPKANPTNNTTYTVTVIDSNACVNTAIVKVFVNPLPVAKAGDDATICQGGKTQFVGGGGYSYKWAPVATLDNANIMNPFASPTVNTVYKVSVYSDKGCVSVDSLTVFVNPIPKADAGIDTAVCYGSGVKLTGSGSENYLWTPNYAIDDTKVASPLVSPSVKTTYILKVSDNIGCSSQDTVVVSIKPVPTAKAMDDNTICYGDTVILTVIGESEYLWDNAESLSQVDIWNPKAFPKTSTMYSVTVTNMYGCTATDEVFVGVKDFVPLKVNTIYYPVVCDGNAVNVVIEASKGNSAYTWSNGASSYKISVKEAGKYKLTVSSESGCVKEIDVDVKAYEASPSPEVKVRGDSLLCYNDSIYLYLDSTYLQYQWSSGSTTDSIKVNSKGHYSVTVTDYNNCVIVSDTALIDMINVPVALVSSIQTSDTTVLMKNFSLYANTYKWYLNEELKDSVEEPVFVIEVDSIYNVRLVVSNQCGMDTANVLVKNISTTSINEIITVNNLRISVYPNPATDFVNIMGDIKVKKSLGIKLYTLTGQLVYEKQSVKSSSIKEKIYVNEFENGIYIIEISIDGRKYYNKVVKN